MMYYML